MVARVTRTRRTLRIGRRGFIMSEVIKFFLAAVAALFIFWVILQVIGLALPGQQLHADTKNELKAVWNTVSALENREEPLLRTRTFVALPRAYMIVGYKAEERRPSKCGAKPCICLYELEKLSDETYDYQNPEKGNLVSCERTNMNIVGSLRGMGEDTQTAQVDAPYATNAFIFKSAEKDTIWFMNAVVPEMPEPIMI